MFTDVEPASGTVERRVEGLPVMTRVWFHAMGPTLGYLKQGRIGHPTRLFFFDLSGRFAASGRFTGCH